MPRASVREVIVESALTQFHRRGFNACSVEDITTAAGVPKGSFYNHFKSKEDLGAEVVRRYGESSSFRAPVPDSLSPLEELRARFHATRERLVTNEFRQGCLLINMGAEVADHSPVIRAEVETSLGNWSHRVADLLREAGATGELSGDLDPDLLAGFVIDAWEGAITRAKVMRSPTPLDDFFTVVFDRLLR